MEIVALWGGLALLIGFIKLSGWAARWCFRGRLAIKSYTMPYVRRVAGVLWFLLKWGTAAGILLYLGSVITPMAFAIGLLIFIAVRVAEQRS
jgi:hypothetical protein